MKMKSKSIQASLIASLMIATSIPVTSFAMTETESNNAIVENVFEDTITDSKELDKIIQSTAKEILNEAPGENGLIREKRTVGFAISVAKKLGKKLGKNYLTSGLPRKIYKAMVKAVPTVGKKFSEGQFVGFFNTYVLLGPLDEVKDIVSNYLDNYMPKWMANSAGAVAQGIIFVLV